MRDERTGVTVQSSEKRIGEASDKVSSVWRLAALSALEQQLWPHAETWTMMRLLKAASRRRRKA